MGDATERLGALLRKAGAVVTFDSARDSSKPCFCCGEADRPRTLEVVGYWTRKVGNRGWPGDTIERPMCAACVVAHETVGRLDLVLSALPHLTGDELRRVAEAMPRVAGEWLDDPEWLVRCYASEDGNGCFMAEACIRDDGWEGYVQGESIGTFPSPRAAQAACDARLEAAGVRLCGEVVRE